jgi:hypothetical protein
MKCKHLKAFGQDWPSNMFEVVREALGKIAMPSDCGCSPCRGQCVCKESLEIELDEIREIAKQALAALTPPSSGVKYSVHCINLPYQCAVDKCRTSRKCQNEILTHPLSEQNEDYCKHGVLREASCPECPSSEQPTITVLKQAAEALETCNFNPIGLRLSEAYYDEDSVREALTAITEELKRLGGIK